MQNRGKVKHFFAFRQEKVYFSLKKYTYSYQKGPKRATLSVFSPVVAQYFAAEEWQVCVARQECS